MKSRDNDISQIMDDIASGFIDDPIEDYKYLWGMLEKYQTHELSEEITQEIANIMFGDLPVAARNELTNSHEKTSFCFMLNQAEHFVYSGQWAPAEMILRNLIGKGISIKDTSETEYRFFDDKQRIQSHLYERIFKTGKKIVQCPVDLGKLYGLYGVVLVERKEISSAQNTLSISLHYNPLELRFFFEYAETFKMSGDIEKVEQLSKEYLGYAYTAADIGHLYRILGYVYTEKEDYETATALYEFALAYDPENKLPEQELEYIAHVSGKQYKEHSQIEAEALLKAAKIQIGVSRNVGQMIYNMAYISSHLHHDAEATDYFCDLYYDVTRNEEVVKEFRSIARQDVTEKNPTVEGFYQDYHPYEDARAEKLKTVFPDFPDITECRLRIEFTVGSTKYAETIKLIYDRIDDLCKTADNNMVTLYFATLESVVKNIKYINDVISIAGKWKSFTISINDVVIPLNIFTNYFASYLHENYKVGYSGGIPEEIQKEYKKASMPPRAKKERPEDAVVYSDLDKLTPQELFRGIIKTYAEVYLSDHEAKLYTVTDEEIVLVADDDLVVDFWLSPYGYGETVSGNPGGATPYRSCTFVIQELTPNNLFRYNNSAFTNIFRKAHICMMFLKYKGPAAYVAPLNHFQKIDKALPELGLQERCANLPGEQYSFVIVRMDNADGGKGYGIGYTGKDARSLMKKICKNLETVNIRILDRDGVNGLIFDKSGSLFSAYQSWKKEKRTERLQNHLEYYVIEKNIKEESELYSIPKEIMKEIETGLYDSVSWNTYADLGRRVKK